jgi:hypothetical protein
MLPSTGSVTWTESVPSPIGRALSHVPAPRLVRQFASLFMICIASWIADWAYRRALAASAAALAVARCTRAAAREARPISVTSIADPRTAM